MIGYVLCILLLAAPGVAVEWGDTAQADLYWGEKLRLEGYTLEASDFTPEEKTPPQVMLNLFEDDERIATRALETGEQSVIVTFDRHPNSVLKPDVSQKLLTSLEDKLAILDEMGIDATYAISFTKQIAEMTAEEFIKNYLNLNKQNLAEKYGLTLTPSRIDVVASYYINHIMDIEKVIKKIKSFYDDIKKIELYFFKNHDINIVLEDDAIDFIIEQFENTGINHEDFYRQLTLGFEHGLKLIREKTGRNRFFITKNALLDPESFISSLIKDELSIS